MYPQRMVRHTLGLALLVTLVVSAVSACGGGGDEEAKARPLPEAPKDLRPGEYRSEEFQPSLTFRVGKGWSSAPLESSDALQITLGQTAGLGFANVQEVYKSSTTGSINLVPAPDDMVGWFQHHPYLQTDEPEPVTLGGVKGVQFDVAVEDLPGEFSSVCGTGCVDIAKFSDGSWIGFVEGDKERVIVLEDVKGKTVIVDFGSSATKFDESAPEAQKVFDTVRWKDM